MITNIPGHKAYKKCAEFFGPPCRNINNIVIVVGWVPVTPSKNMDSFTAIYILWLRESLPAIYREGSKTSN